MKMIYYMNKFKAKGMKKKLSSLVATVNAFTKRKWSKKALDLFMCKSLKLQVEVL